MTVSTRFFRRSPRRFNNVLLGLIRGNHDDRTIGRLSPASVTNAQFPRLELIHSAGICMDHYLGSHTHTHTYSRNANAHVCVCVLYQLHRPLTSEVARELGRKPTTVRRRFPVFSQGKTIRLLVSDFIRSDSRSPSEVARSGRIDFPPS